MQNDLREYVRSILPSDAERFFEDYSKLTTIRLNRLKIRPEELTTRLTRRGITLESLPIADAVIVREQATSVSKSLEHFLGLLYIQSVASMIPSLVLDPQPHETVLDLCAAPGSKTTQMAQMMNNRGRLVANEYDDKRIKTLSHNLDRMGILNTALVNMAGERIGNLIPETFDKVLVDAPCSALGVIHKAPEAVRNIPKIAHYAQRQEQLLLSAIKAAKVGGTIVYSTCTIAPEENESVVHNMIAKYPVETVGFHLPEGIPAMPALESHNGRAWDRSISRARRLLPNSINPEGFFVAKLKKLDTIPVAEKNPFPNHRVRFDVHDAGRKEISNMIRYFETTFGIDPQYWSRFGFVTKPDEILASSAEWLGAASFLERIFTHRVGTRLARMRREGEWKLSTNFAQIAHEKITRHRVDLQSEAEAQAFVEAGTIRRGFDVDRGGVVAFFDGLALGCGVIHQGVLKSQMPKSRTVIGVEW